MLLINPVCGDLTRTSLFPLIWSWPFFYQWLRCFVQRNHKKECLVISHSWISSEILKESGDYEEELWLRIIYLNQVLAQKHPGAGIYESRVVNILILMNWTCPSSCLPRLLNTGCSNWKLHSNLGICRKSIHIVADLSVSNFVTDTSKLCPSQTMLIPLYQMIKHCNKDGTMPFKCFKKQ